MPSDSGANGAGCRQRRYPDRRTGEGASFVFRTYVAAGFLIFNAAAAWSAPLETPANQKPRVVITADPELDDSNSLVRYLLFSSDFKTEGLIYASGQFHWK